MKLTAGVSCTALVALGVAAWWLWRQPAAPIALPPSGERSLAEQRALAEQMSARVDERARADPNARTPIAAAPVDPTGTIRLRMLDATSGQPIAGARVFDIQGARVCATAGEDGVARAPQLAPGRLVFCADGYLANLPEFGDETATSLQAAATGDAVADVELLPDTFTLPCSLRFVDAAGLALGETVRCSLQCLDEPPPSGLSFPSARLAPGTRVDRALVDAWQRHVRVQSLLGEAADALHLGVHSHDQVFLASGGVLTLRCVAAGSYRVSACAPQAGLAGERTLQLALGDRASFEVKLAPGRFIDGVVLEVGSERPIAGASVTLRQGSGLTRGAVSADAEGRFRLGPLPAAQVELAVHSARHVEQDVRASVGVAVRVLLAPRPMRAVRGVVRQRPRLQPIAGADVLVRGPLGVDCKTTTGPDGAFTLATALENGDLAVFTPGCLPWLERLDQPVESYVCDLFPSDVQARVRAGLTTLLEGRVLDARSNPVGGLPVQLFTDEVVIPEGIAGRAVLEGHILPLRPLAMAGDDGAFAIEWFRAGEVRLVAADAQAEPLPLSLILGMHVRDLVIRVAR